MIYLYNNTSKPFTLTEGQKFSSIGTMREIDNKGDKVVKKYASVPFSGKKQPKAIDLDKYVNMNTPVRVHEMNTNVFFNKKTAAPYIVTGAKNVKDIFCLGIDLKGSIVTNVGGYGSYVLDRFIAKGSLCAIISLSENCTEFFVTVHNNRDRESIQYKFVRTDNGWRNEISRSKDEEDLDTPSYDIRRFRPSHVTEFVLVRERDKEFMDKLGIVESNDRDNYNVYEYTGREMLDDIIEAVLAEGYTAVTLYVRDISVSGKYYKHYVEDIEYLQEQFSAVNILLNNKAKPIVKLY